ncbi:5-oxoprolinase subunit C family protein [Hirschia baltica]|uniref:Allophanate hydrolase subunit 2 n=1 Tax=Hirschia baltica (strain ATCC 49814 / DSM 5838 / IFAM 1418) TaxID=582402 RepID=C6XL44_HIRBI|nr:biotin-dependent carboxyltransferase family protein [Hirschia baltica]ACT57873.1 Allophanate hydrolase subunit 2 [Hirschia baltica ATCC 49814]
MSLIIIRPGMQASLQGRPRLHHRHQGVPASGPADEHSFALANLAVGNSVDTTCVEITAGGFETIIKHPATIALSGAPCPAYLNTQAIPFYQPIKVKADDVLILEPPPFGFRTYLAIAGGLEASSFLDSTSTYMPAHLGGHSGRALKPDDEIKFANSNFNPSPKPIPKEIYPFFSNHWLLRIGEGAEFGLLSESSKNVFLNQNFKAGTRISRMGIQLETPTLSLISDGRMKSEPVFPGTIQCPENGKPFILLSDAQTTGGYPRIGQVIRADRHRLGQIRPNDKITFVLTQQTDAVNILKHQQNAINAGI